jgi:hypothetical protein
LTRVFLKRLHCLYVFPLALPSSLQTTSFSFQLQAVVCTQFLSLSLSVRYRVAASELSSTERWHSLFWSFSSPLSFPILCSSWESETVHKVKLYVHSIYVVVVSKLFSSVLQAVRGVCDPSLGPMASLLIAFPGKHPKSLF